MNREGFGEGLVRTEKERAQGKSWMTRFLLYREGQKGRFPCPIQCPQFIGIKKGEEKRRIPYIETIHV
jgi:hypothetical protein